MTSDEPGAYDRRGQGSPLVLMQGMSATRHFWGEEFLRLLDRHFDLLVMDHRGVAASPHPAERFSMTDLALDAARLIEEQGWADVGIFGVSMGGMVAQELSLIRPDLVTYAVLGCTRANGRPFMRRGDPATERLMAAYVHGDEATTSRNMFALSFSEGFADAPDAWPAYAKMARVRIDPATTLRQIEAIQGFDRRESLADLRMPVLVLHGSRDQMVPFEEGLDVARRIANSSFESIVDAGHFFWVEQPSRVVDLMTTFVTGLRSGVLSD